MPTDMGVERLAGTLETRPSFLCGLVERQKLIPWGNTNSCLQGSEGSVECHPGFGVLLLKQVAFLAGHRDLKGLDGLQTGTFRVAPQL